MWQVCLILALFAGCRSERLYLERTLLAQRVADDPGGNDKYRLPNYVQPTSYDLTIQPDLEAGSFTGIVAIKLKVASQTDLIVLNLNSDYITINESSISGTVDPSTKVVNTSQDNNYEQVNITLSAALTTNDTSTLTIKYAGKLGDDMLGFYLSSYNSTNGTTETTHWMAITQFESTYARRAFPCFDEPAFRAPVTVTIIHPPTQTSMSNMGIEKTTIDNKTGIVTDTYYPTPPIPTYLVAFGVSDLEYLPNITSDFRVIARKAAEKDASYLVNVGPSILDNIGKFLSYNYSMFLKKMDVVAVPDFDAGAMENWGLTTYREKYVLYNPEKNTLRDKWGVLSVVAHEFGHQWFGDLVTPEWWSYAWLNEAFATYFEYTISTQMTEQEWNIGSTMYVLNAVQYALDADVGSPRPMTYNVYTPKQIENQFDYVIYEKGGSVLRMTEDFLTTAAWKAGLNKYLTANKEGTGTPEELFTALTPEDNNSLNVTKILQGWTTQPGYPLVTVTRHNFANNKTTYNITQTPYALNNETTGYTWAVPLTYTTSESPEFNPTKAPHHWLYPSDPTTATLSVMTNQSDGWIIVNVDQIGFYRVNYDASNWKKLTAQLNANFSVVGDINRAQLLDDAFHLAKTGHLDYPTALGLTAYLPKETAYAYAPWIAFFTNMRFLINQFYNTPTGNGLQEYARGIMAKPFQVLWNALPSSTDNFLLSTTIKEGLQFSCEMGLSDCETGAKTIFDQWRSNQTNYEINPVLERAVLCTGLRLESSTPAAFLDVWNLYLSSDNAAEKHTIMHAMACTANEDAINKYLDAVTDKNANLVRKQDQWVAFSTLSGQQSGVMPVLTYIVNNYSKVSNALGSRLSGVISTMGNTISQPSHIKVVKSLVASGSQADPALQVMLNNTVIPAINKRQQWVNSAQGSSLVTWVESQAKSSSASVAVSVSVMLMVSILHFLN